MKNKDKILAILLSVVVAFGLWLYVITVVSPESEKTYYEIPVYLQNKEILSERGLIVSGEVPTVTLALRGKRSILNSLNESNINVFINVANIETPGVHQLTYSVSYPGNITLNEISVQSSSTDLITLNVEKLLKKQVPVNVKFVGEPLSSVFKCSVEKAYETIEVSGPESVISQIQKAEIEIDLTDKTEDIQGEYSYTLYDGEGKPVSTEEITTNIDKVHLHVKIRLVKEIALKVEVIYGGGATEQNCTIVLDREKLTVSGSNAKLQNITELVVGTINLGNYSEDALVTFDLKSLLEKNGLTSETGVEQVNVDIQFAKLINKTLQVKNIVYENVPAGYEVDIVTEVRPVIVRGPAEQINAIQPEDIELVVDFTGAAAVMTEYAAAVRINGEAYPDVGAVGSYTVTATLKAAS